MSCCRCYVMFFSVQTETALINDAVLVFAKALNELARAQDIKTEGLSCSRSDSWKNGNSLLNYMKLVSTKGCNIQASGRFHHIFPN